VFASDVCRFFIVTDHAMTNPMHTAPRRRLPVGVAVLILMMPSVALLAGPAVALGNATESGASDVRLTSAQPGDRLVAASLLTELAEVAPGSTLTIGVQLEMAPGWHIYWVGQNDSGTAPAIEWTLPAGWKAGPIAWPSPQRYSPTEGLLDYVYHGRAVLLIPLSVPAEARVGDTVRLAARVSWLACKDACVPGRAELAAEVRIAPRTGDPSPRMAELFRAARASIPKPIPAGAPWLSHSWSGTTLTLKVPGAARLVFMPHESGALLRNALEQGAADADVLTLSFRQSEADDAAAPRRVLGVLEVTRRTTDGRTSVEHWVLDVPLPGGMPEVKPDSR
jgi:thiol:disulfide interchange protein DsbD